MVNAVRILSDFVSRLPRQNLSPETTDGRDGFMHPYQVQGGVSEASCQLFCVTLRPKTSQNRKSCWRTSLMVCAVYPECGIRIETKKQYRNMRDGLHKEPRAIPKAIEAVRAAGIEPIMDIIRGGTDKVADDRTRAADAQPFVRQYNPHSPWNGRVSKRWK